MGEIDSGINKLTRRIQDLESLNVRDAVLKHTAAVKVAQSNIRESILETFGPDSPEYAEYGNIGLWFGPIQMEAGPSGLIQGRELGRRQAIGILKGLVTRLQEKRESLADEAALSPTTHLDRLNLHPRISDVSRELFADGHPWEAVFAASKALINYVKERSGQHDLDGAPLVRAVFSKKAPLLAFNELASQADLDEQEGMMHLFEGVVLAIRNPGGHSFPEGPERRAIEYISLISMLAYRVQESERRKAS